MENVIDVLAKQLSDKKKVLNAQNKADFLDIDEQLAKLKLAKVSQKKIMADEQLAGIFSQPQQNLVDTQVG